MLMMMRRAPGSPERHRSRMRYAAIAGAAVLLVLGALRIDRYLANREPQAAAVRFMGCWSARDHAGVQGMLVDPKSVFGHHPYPIYPIDYDPLESARRFLTCSATDCYRDGDEATVAMDAKDTKGTSHPLIFYLSRAGDRWKVRDFPLDLYLPIQRAGGMAEDRGNGFRVNRSWMVNGQHWETGWVSLEEADRIERRWKATEFRQRTFP